MFEYLDHICKSQYKGGCNQVCKERGPRAVCSCWSSEFYLTADGKTCAPGKIKLNTIIYLVCFRDTTPT